MKRLFACLAALASLAVLAQTADSPFNLLRGTAPLNTEGAAPVMPKPINDDVRKGRAYTMQPPVIPHQIDNYQVDANHNKCMTCHARDRVQETQAIMVSVTHYTDRDGNFRAEISPRRYFCTQCHVPQLDVKVPVKNTFQDVKTATAAAKPAGKSK